MKRFIIGNMVYLLILIIGAITIFMSTDPRLTQYATYIGAIGGAIFGVGASALLGRIASKPEVEILSDLVQRQYEALNGYDRLTSDPAEIRKFEGRWYCYTVSARPDKVLWRLAVYDISPDYDTGSIRFSVDFFDNDDEKSTYLYTGMVRGERLVIFGASEKKVAEPCIIQVFPHAGVQKSQSYNGITFHKSWSGHNSISPTLISRKPVVDFDNDKKAAEEISAKLDEVWRANSKNDGTLFLPRFSSSVAEPAKTSV